MPPSPAARSLRILAIFAIGPLFLATLALLAYLNFKYNAGGIAGFIGESFAYKPVREFAFQYGARILLPVYVAGGLAAWILTYLVGLLADRGWKKAWTAKEALLLGCSALLWVHVLLWWEVPTTLWNLPGLRSLPFGLVLPLLTGLALAGPLAWLRRTPSWGRRILVLGGWLAAWSLLAWFPRMIPRPLAASRGGDQVCKVLMLGIDGLRADTFAPHVHKLQGITYTNAYTPIPATRLLWHILWGGDPLTFTVGHVGPSLEEFSQPHQLELLRLAKEKGWQPRFYIDDGGTIGITGRQMDLDDALMPAAGWENFVNSNLAASFPLYAIWENWFKPFPTTNPWAGMDEGLKEALRLGRGSGWVMFHSCLAHQPIYLTRKELGQLPRWWSLKPKSLRPTSHIAMVDEAMLQSPDPRTNPYVAYKLRMASIVDAWTPIWNGLAQDPHYKGAMRVLFSDHGERFHNVANGFQLMGVHGFDLNPWEAKIAMKVAGPAFGEGQGALAREATISLLSIRDVIHRSLKGEDSLRPQALEQAFPAAPLRYHTLDGSAFGEDLFEFRTQSVQDMVSKSYIGPAGIWVTEYSRPASERAQDVSVALAEGEVFTSWKPLKAGGAQRYRYRGYQFQGMEPVDEKAFREAKARVEKLLVQPR